jgi:hypothetical protein
VKVRSPLGNFVLPLFGRDSPWQRVKGARIAGPQRAWLGEKLKVRYSKRTSIRELAEANRRSYGLGHRLLVGSGVELRGRGDSQRSRTPAGNAN